MRPLSVVFKRSVKARGKQTSLYAERAGFERDGSTVNRAGDGGGAAASGSARAVTRSDSDRRVLIVRAPGGYNPARTTLQGRRQRGRPWPGPSDSAPLPMTRPAPVLRAIGATRAENRPRSAEPIAGGRRDGNTDRHLNCEPQLGEYKDAPAAAGTEDRRPQDRRVSHSHIGIHQYRIRCTGADTDCPLW